jgi:hypothetical protein
MIPYLIQRLRQAERDATVCANMGEKILQQQAELMADALRQAIKEKCR